MRKNVNLSQTVNIFPLLAYQKIYSDFFRNTQWEKPNPSTFNVDFMTGKDLTSMNYMQRVKTADSTYAKFSVSYNLFDLRYCDFQQDIFHGILPQAQYGETSFVPLFGGSSVSPGVLHGNVKLDGSTDADWNIENTQTISGTSNITPAAAFSGTNKTNLNQYKFSGILKALQIFLFQVLISQSIPQRLMDCLFSPSAKLKLIKNGKKYLSPETKIIRHRFQNIGMKMYLIT